MKQLGLGLNLSTKKVCKLKDRYPALTPTSLHGRQREVEAEPES